MNYTATKIARMMIAYHDTVRCRSVLGHANSQARNTDHYKKRYEVALRRFNRLVPSGIREEIVRLSELEQ